MKLEANFSEISSSFEALPADVPLTVTIDEVEAGDTKNGIPQLVFKHTVVAPPEHAGRKVFDFVTLKTSKGEVNKIGLGRVKAYVEATQGQEAANGTEIDTDSLVGSSCIVILKQRTYEQNGEQKTANDVAKILPQG